MIRPAALRRAARARAAVRRVARRDSRRPRRDRLPGRHALTALFALGLGALGCGSADSFSGDPFPIYVERARGAFVVQFTTGDEPVTEARLAVLDLLSPITVLDAALGAAPRRRGVELALVGRRSPTDARPVTRARFDATALFLHPCDDVMPCAVGSPGAPTAIAAVIGADTLRGDAIRFTPTEDRIAVLADVAGDVRDRACDTEQRSPFYGGGTLVVGGTEVAFSGLRVALGVCLAPDPDQPEAALRGTDAAMVLSTGIGPSIIGAARYEAWRAAAPPDHPRPPFETLPPSTVLLTSGPIDGHLARIDGLAIVGTATAPRGACREVYAHHRLTAADCPQGDPTCPCTPGDEFCSAPSVLELATSIEVLVVPDEHPLLQALRAELRPALPEIDGILGISALAAAELDVDYPNDRLLFRCAGPGCSARPALRSRESRAIIDACVLRGIPALDAGTDAELDAGSAMTRPPGTSPLGFPLESLTAADAALGGP